MTIAEFKNKAKVEEYNTTNGWGFAGLYGKMFTINEHKARITRWSYRHAGTEQQNAYFINGERVELSQFKASIKYMKL